MRVAFRAIAVLLFACFCLSPARAELPYEEFTNVCVASCAKSAEKSYCADYCQCNLDGIKAKGDEAAQTAALGNVEELNRIAMTCSGKLGVDVFVKACKADCKGAACEKCDCMLNEIKALGAETKIGEFLAGIGRGDAAATAQMSTMQTKCMK